MLTGLWYWRRGATVKPAGGEGMKASGAWIALWVSLAWFSVTTVLFLSRCKVKVVQARRPVLSMIMTSTV